jgi:hypothetical protein
LCSFTILLIRSAVITGFLICPPSFFSSQSP